MKIRGAKITDVESIYQLEQTIEKENAVSKETLLKRLKMFPKGFYIAEHKGEIIGYIESCLWNRTTFKTFNEIKDFPKHHDVHAKILYIIFIAVKEGYQRKGVGSQLVKVIIDYAVSNYVEKIQLVSKDGLSENFYKKIGFREIKKLPFFTPTISGILMEYKINSQN